VQGYPLTGLAQICKFLIAQSADIGAADAKGRQPAHWAAYRHQIEVLVTFSAAGRRHCVHSAMPVEPAAVRARPVAASRGCRRCCKCCKRPAPSSTTPTRSA
jgi:hypothetical protein